jgi:hypothetical protein
VRGQKAARLEQELERSAANKHMKNTAKQLRNAIEEVGGWICFVPTKKIWNVVKMMGNWIRFGLDTIEIKRDTLIIVGMLVMLMVREVAK